MADLKGKQTKLDANKDGKISGEDFALLRVSKAKGGKMKDQMDALAISVEPVTVKETPMLPDEEMEENYVDYVVEETLSNEDRNYLIDALEKDDRLSEIFDQVVESATEFTGSGTVEGPGTGRSDSIPARLSDGEFVFTAKATEEIGADNLMSMMKDAEAAVNERQQMANGGEVEEEETVYKAKPEPQTQDIRVTKETVGSQAMMKEEEDLVGDELKKSMLSTRPYVRS
jgi:Sec-independent protein translocase protein TatA|tara:strand:+ start:102 stop:788 length:687 start_codon:yes stop_codon:yes gene_type:complete